MSLNSQTWDPQLKVPPGGLVLRIFTTSAGNSMEVLQDGDRMFIRKKDSILDLRVVQ